VLSYATAMEAELEALDAADAALHRPNELEEAVDRWRIVYLNACYESRPSEGDDDEAAACSEGEQPREGAASCDGDAPATSRANGKDESSGGAGGGRASEGAATDGSGLSSSGGGGPSDGVAGGALCGAVLEEFLAGCDAIASLLQRLAGVAGKAVSVWRQGLRPDRPRARCWLRVPARVLCSSCALQPARRSLRALIDVAARCGAAHFGALICAPARCVVAQCASLARV
jgi:hypothetical protein